MIAAITIDRATGDIRIGDAADLTHGLEKAAVTPRVSRLLVGSTDHDNGYEWLSLQGLAFGSRPASLALGFRGGRFERASWSVQMIGAENEEGWPTRDAIEEEIAFVRRILLEDMGLHAGHTAWGEVWSALDPRSHTASNGFRYRRSPYGMDGVLANPSTTQCEGLHKRLKWGGKLPGGY